MGKLLPDGSEEYYYNDDHECVFVFLHAGSKKEYRYYFKDGQVIRYRGPKKHESGDAVYNAANYQLHLTGIQPGQSSGVSGGTDTSGTGQQQNSNSDAVAQDQADESGSQTEDESQPEAGGQEGPDNGTVQETPQQQEPLQQQNAGDE